MRPSTQATRLRCLSDARPWTMPIRMFIMKKLLAYILRPVTLIQRAMRSNLPKQKEDMRQRPFL